MNNILIMSKIDLKRIIKPYVIIGNQGERSDVRYCEYYQLER